MPTTLDGRAIPEALFAADPFRPLIALLREECGAMEPKHGCGIGRCGACLVLLDGVPAAACLTPAHAAAGRAITTADGLPSAPAQAVRAALEAERAFQCGACAPGVVLALTWLLITHPDTAAPEAEALLVGQICRCAAHGGLRRAIAQLFPQPT
ncbi:MAG: 2Fe-2S iron-sulfur cluster-binding protein [Alphaproteobacteria bacterium]|nr:2Fe-2S iron-sulfur cluster-binding protein [Alphaproteobacteria bacterium]